MAENDLKKGMAALNQYFTGFETEIAYVILTVDSEEYGIEALRIREMTKCAKPIKIPGLPAFVEGVMNLRGQMIPVLDLRKLFGGGFSNQDDPSVTVVVEAAENRYALIANQVSDFQYLPQSNIIPIEERDAKGSDYYFQAYVERDGQWLFLLDIDKIVDFEEAAQHQPGFRDPSKPQSGMNQTLVRTPDNHETVEPQAETFEGIKRAGGSVESKINPEFGDRALSAIA